MALIINPNQNPGMPSTTATPTNISFLFDAINSGVTNLAQGQAETTIAQGDTSEASAYGSAADIASANARLAQIAGQVQQAQTQLQINQTIGSQRAAVAANGFAESGSALSLLRSSTQQGLLQQQVIGINSQEQAAGYLEQAAASTAEQAAATGAASSATALSASETAIGTASKTNAINEAAAMGLAIPGLSDLSATNIPTVNPVTVGQQAGAQSAGGVWGGMFPSSATFGTAANLTGAGSGQSLFQTTQAAEQAQQQKNFPTPTTSTAPTGVTPQSTTGVLPAPGTSLTPGLPNA